MYLTEGTAKCFQKNMNKLSFIPRWKRAQLKVYLWLSLHDTNKILFCANYPSVNYPLIAGLYPSYKPEDKIRIKKGYFTRAMWTF